MKQFKNRHTDLNKGEDPRSNKQLIQTKQKKMMDKVRQNRKKGEKDPKGGKGRKDYGEKHRNKIIQRSKPTRSKVIMKSGGGKHEKKRGGFRR